MGIAKNIEAYAIYQDYTENTELFIKKLSDILNADFIVNTFDIECNLLHKRDKITAYSKPNKYRLNIWYYESGMPVYELTLPINYEYNNNIELVFSSNKSVHIMFLTFEHSWNEFIETLKFDEDFYYEDRQQRIERYKNLRNEYIRIFNTIGIDSIFIVTDALYQIEDIVDEETYPILTFSDIPRIAKEIDNLTSFDLEEILQINKVSEMSKYFMAEPSLNIAFIDNLNIVK
ncbi:MAG: hypothetical protein FWF65_09620 [Bacteroidetes bacterium]|nr:hypothetical protein [Bacteroidota bacterium]